MSAKIVRPCHCGVFIGLKQIGSFAYHLDAINALSKFHVNQKHSKVSRETSYLKNYGKPIRVYDMWLAMGTVSAQTEPNR